MTALTSATPASVPILAKNLDKDGIVRLEIVEDLGQQPPQLSLRITGTVLLIQDDFNALVTEFSSPTGNPRKVIQRATVTRTPQFERMAPEKPRKDSTGTKGTGGVPNDLVTTDFANSSSLPNQYTVHTEVYLKELSNQDRQNLIALIAAKNVKDLVTLLSGIGEDVDENELRDLLKAALS